MDNLRSYVFHPFDDDTCPVFGQAVVVARDEAHAWQLLAQQFASRRARDWWWLASSAPFEGTGVASMQWSRVGEIQRHVMQGQQPPMPYRALRRATGVRKGTKWVPGLRVRSRRNPKRLGSIVRPNGCNVLVQWDDRSEPRKAFRGSLEPVA